MTERLAMRLMLDSRRQRKGADLFHRCMKPSVSI
jgi:hypothetical protein